MVTPIRFSGAAGALSSGSAIQIQINPRDIARVKKRFDQNRGAPLFRRMQIASLKAADLLKPAIANSAPRKTGYLRRSVRARPATQRLGGQRYPTTGALVGPTAPHRFLVIHGHRVVTPGGRYLGRSTRPNPFVKRAGDPLKAQALAIIKREAFI